MAKKEKKTEIKVENIYHVLPTSDLVENTWNPNELS